MTIVQKSQKGLKHTTQRSIICVQHHVPKTQAMALSVSIPQASFCLPPPGLHDFPSDYHHNVVCVYALCIRVFWLIPSPSFIESPTSSLTAISLFHVSMPLFLFCSTAYFVHEILHVSEIMWYLPFSNWFTSFSIIISRCMHMKSVQKVSIHTL